MNRRRIVILAAVVLLVRVSASAADDRDPRFGPEGEKHIVELTHWLEANPLTKDKSRVQEVLTWWIDNPDLTLNWCAGMLIDGKNEEISPIVVSQGLFGAGAYLIQHPKEAEDRQAIHLAGVQSALTLYKTAVEQNKKMRDSFYDDLVARWDAGTLDAWVQQQMRECQDASE